MEISFVYARRITHVGFVVFSTHRIPVYEWKELNNSLLSVFYLLIIKYKR